MDHWGAFLFNCLKRAHSDDKRGENVITVPFKVPPVIESLLWTYINSCLCNRIERRTFMTHYLLFILFREMMRQWPTWKECIETTLSFVVGCVGFPRTGLWAIWEFTDFIWLAPSASAKQWVQLCIASFHAAHTACLDQQNAKAFMYKKKKCQKVLSCLISQQGPK